MISPGTHSCFLSQITINRADRQRRSIDDIESLADSIRRLGLIHPIVLDRDYNLVAGERRLSACKALGWDRIEHRFTDELDPRELKLIELEENIKRKNLSWQEENDAITAIHDIYKQLDPTTDVAEKIGRSPENLRQHLLVRVERASNPRIAAAETFRTARTIAKAAVDRRAADEFNEHVPPGRSYTPVLNQSFHDWAPAYRGPGFNLIHCDFPYGINAQDSSANPSSYSDTPVTFLELLKTLAVHLDSFCAESAHMIFWFSPSRIAETWENLKLLDGFTFDDTPLIWHKSDSRGIAPDSSRRPRRIYETAFFGWRGDRRLVTLRDNLFSAPTERLVHSHEKSEVMLRYFLSMVVAETSRVLDPTCGSGSALRAAKVLGASSILGLEIDPAFAADANRLLADTHRGLDISEGV